jgi:hypothetical protein
VIAALGELLTLPYRPAAGVIPRGLTGSQTGSNPTVWMASRGDILQAHRLHITAAQQLRHSPRLAAQYLEAAAECRQLLSLRRWFNVYNPSGRRIQGLYTRSEAHAVIQVLETSSNYSGWVLHTAEEL